MEPRDVDLYVDEACRAHRPGHGQLKLLGDEHEETLVAAGNYAATLVDLKHFQEAKALVRKTMPVARRVLGKSDETTLRMRAIHARALYSDPAATLDDSREAVTTLEDTIRIARRVLGGAHPVTTVIENSLQKARDAVGAREAGQSIVFTRE